MKLENNGRLGVFAIITTVLMVAIWHPFFNTSAILFSTDDNIGIESMVAQCLPGGFLGWWSDGSMLGSNAGRIPFTWTPLLLTLLPVNIFVNFIHAVDLLLAAAFIFFFLKRAGCSPLGAWIGAFTVCWVSSNFTITYGGHNPKFAVLWLSAAALFCIGETVRTRRPAWALLTGSAMGFALVEQQDVGLFFGIVIGCYALFSIGRMSEVTWPRRWMVYLLPMAVGALWISAPAAFQGYMKNVHDISSAGVESPAAQWDFATQWSLPPDESMALVAPGFMGWRSGEPEGPYWGRMGGSANWEQTGQGFMNFKLDDWYLGIIPVIFMLLACGSVFFSSSDDAGRAPGPGGAQERRAEIIFWSCATAIALLLAWGKYFPLYGLFYHLPLVGSIRNPVKFLQVFQLAAGILTAYGIDQVLLWRKPGAGDRAPA